MVLEEIPLINILPEVEKAITELLLSESNGADFLGADGHGLESIYDLYGTDYEDIIPAFISCGSGESWGMHGKIFKFKLSDELKRHILKESLTLMPCAKLENLTLYRGEKVIFSCLSHEVFCMGGMSEIAEDLRERTIFSAKQAVRLSPLYAEMKKVHERLRYMPAAKIKKEMAVLRDLHCYVDRAKRAWFYQNPRYECDIGKFRKIAAQYLTADLLDALNVKSFEDLQPLPVAHTTEEVLSGIGKNTPQFLSTPLYSRLSAELAVLEFIREEEFGEK